MTRKTLNEPNAGYKIRYASPHFDLGAEDIRQIKEILSSGWVSIGRHVRELEENFKSLCGTKYAVAATSASQALSLAVKALGWKKIKVALPSFTWPSTYYAIEEIAGIEPVFCDIDPRTWLIDLEYLKKQNKKFDAVIAVDLFGSQCRIDTDKPVLYDAAHGFGLPRLGRRGIIEVVSLSFSKIISAGEGGVILTNDATLAKNLRYLRRVTSRMSEINAYLCNRAIKNKEKYRIRRMGIVEAYRKHLKIPYSIQEIPEATNYSVFSILLPERSTREKIVTAFRKNGVEVKIYHDPLISGLAVTDDIYSRIIALPVNYDIQDRVPELCGLINKAAA